MYNKKITWKKKNGEEIQRIVGGIYCDYRIGNKNSYGWEITDIEYQHGKSWYHLDEFKKELEKESKRHRRKETIKRAAFQIYNELKFGTGMLILIRTADVLTRHYN